MKYNQHFKPLNNTIEEKSVVISFTYKQLQAIGNALWDLHMQEPETKRLEKYPFDKMQQPHQEIYAIVCNCTKSLEAMDQAERE